MIFILVLDKVPGTVCLLEYINLSYFLNGREDRATSSIYETFYLIHCKFTWVLVILLSSSLISFILSGV